MGFRINRGIFQFLPPGETEFINKFKIAEDGEMVEVDRDGVPTTAYMKIGDKATDSDLLDGVTSASFLRSDAADTISASLFMGTQQAIKASNYGHGVYGKYDSRKYQHVWGMGSSWHMDAGGSSLGNFYGLAYTHTNIGGESKGGLSHQTLFVENGLTKTAIGRGIWTDGTITATGNANISGNLDIGGAVVGTSSGVALAVGGTSTYGVHTGDNARNQLVVSANYYPHFVIAADLNNNPNHGAVISMVGTEGSSPRQWNIGISNQNPFLFSIGYNRSGDNNPHYGVGDNWSNDDNNHARLSIDRDGNTKIRGSLYVNGTKGGITTGSKVATETYASTVAGEVDNRIETEIKPLITTAQSTADTAQTTADTALTTAQTAETRANSAREDAAAIGDSLSGYIRSNVDDTATGNLTFNGKVIVDSPAQYRVFHAKATRSAGLGTSSLGSNTAPFLFENTGGDQAWGIVAEFRLNEDGRGGDSPAILFSDAQQSTQWSVGFDYTGSEFGIRKNRGSYSQGWGTSYMRINTLGDTWFYGNVEVGKTLTANNISTNQVFMQSITSDGTIANDKGSYLHLGGWAVGRTDASAVLVNTAYRADYATNLFNENISRFANDANYLTQDALTSVEEGLRAEINGVETVANSKQDAGNYATFTNNITLNNSATTADFIAELTNEHGAFQNNYKAFKVTWSYAGNSNLDVGFESVELAGCLVECWGGTYKHVRLTRPTTGTGGRSIYVYNDQGSGYAPGWRQIWTSDEFSSTSVSNWNTAYGWGNHASAGYLTTSGKAADSDKLDGYDWMQSGKNIRGTEIYADNWFRNYNSGEGIYNQSTGVHWYSDDASRWRFKSGSSSAVSLLLATSNDSARGYVYANSGNEVGFLDAGGSWAIKHTNDNGTRFYTDGSTEEFKVGRDAVTGSYGTVQTSTTRGGWGGYSIAGRYVFMSDHGSTAGIYNDVDNEWMAIFRRNSSVDLYYNNSLKFVTTSTGAAVTGTMTATSFAGDGAGLTNVSAPIPFTTVTGEATACVSMNFDGRAMVFTMADGTSYSIDGARPNQ